MLPLAAVVVACPAMYGYRSDRQTPWPADWLASAPLALAAMVLAALTVQRNADYCRSGADVDQGRQAVAPQNARASLAGSDLQLRGDRHRAKRYFERAIALTPDHATTHGNLGTPAGIVQGDLSGAE